MSLENQNPALECANYESIIGAVSLIPETIETLQADAGCDTCIHFGNNSCNLNSNPLNAWDY